MNPRLAPCLAVLTISVLSGCASGPGPSAAVSPAQDLPDRFQVLDADGQARAARAGEGCRNPLIDPRNQTRLQLQQSAEGKGDYEVPAGTYGAVAGQWLRVECATGMPLGWVKGN